MVRRSFLPSRGGMTGSGGGGAPTGALAGTGSDRGRSSGCAVELEPPASLRMAAAGRGPGVPGSVVRSSMLRGHGCNVPAKTQRLRRGRAAQRRRGWRDAGTGAVSGARMQPVGRAGSPADPREPSPPRQMRDRAPADPARGSRRRRGRPAGAWLRALARWRSPRAGRRVPAGSGGRRRRSRRCGPVAPGAGGGTGPRRSSRGARRGRRSRGRARRGSPRARAATGRSRSRRGRSVRTPSARRR